MRPQRVALAFVGLMVAASCDHSSAVDVRTPGVRTDGPSTSSPSLPTPSPTVLAEDEAPTGERAKVVRVVDGDTLVLAGIDVGETDRRTGGRKARLIGIDTPEVYGGAECLGREASAFTRAELDGKQVVVGFDVDVVDRYGRALVYIWSPDGAFFNERIVAQGFALPMTVPPNVRYADVFVEAARDARTHGRGLWSRC
ncbi:MAG: thermonuclease family protein [bacterium]